MPCHSIIFVNYITESFHYTYFITFTGLTRLVDKLPKTVDKDDPNTKETFTKAVKEHLTGRS